MRPSSEAELAEAVAGASGPLLVRGGGTRTLGHAVGEVLAAVSIEGRPRGVWLAGVPVGDGVIGLHRHERKRAQFPAFVGDEADLL